MGVNEFGVCAGNEALYPKKKNDGGDEKDGLIGMDLVRLVLERAQSAHEGVDILVKLLEEFGQRGQAGYEMDHRYDNGFLVCDEKEAFLIETWGRDWQVVKREEGVHNISNFYNTKPDDVSVQSEHLEERGKELGLVSKDGGKVDLRSNNNSFFYNLGTPHTRCKAISSHLNSLSKGF